LAVGLAAVLRSAESDAARLLAEIRTAPPLPPTLPPPPEPQRGWRLVEQSKRDNLDPAKAREALGAIERRMREKPARRLTIDWRIEEPEGNG
jgi:hypothetical protein